MTTTTINPDNSNEYIGYVEGYVTTTSPDAHGDAIPLATIEGMAERLKSDKQLQVLTLNHDPTQKIGRVLQMRVDKKASWAGLWVRVGVFRSRLDAWEMLESGKLRGFSVGIGVKDYVGKLPVGETSSECEFRVVVPGVIWHDVDDLLRGAGAETYPIVRKALPAETVIFVGGSVASISSLILSLVGLFLSRRNRTRQGSEDTEISVVVEEERIKVTPDSAERIIRRIKSSAKSSKRHGRN